MDRGHDGHDGHPAVPRFGFCRLAVRAVVYGHAQSVADMDH